MTMVLSRMLLSKRKRRGISRKRRRIDDNGDRQARRNDVNGDPQEISNDDIYDDPGDRKAWRNYNGQVLKIEGFDIVDFPDSINGEGLCGLPTPLIDIPQNSSKYKMLSKYAEFAIKQYNCDQDVDYEFISLEKANARVVQGLEYFFTIKVNNPITAGDGYELFEAQVCRRVENMQVILCQPKPEKPEPKKLES